MFAEVEEHSYLNSQWFANLGMQCDAFANKEQFAQVDVFLFANTNPNTSHHFQKNHLRTVLLIFRIPAYHLTVYKCQILAICDLTRENHVNVLFLIRGTVVSVLFSIRVL